MPVTNQWRTRTNDPGVKPADGAPKPDAAKDGADGAAAAGRRVGRLQNLKTGKGAADAKPAEPSSPPADANGQGAGDQAGGHGPARKTVAGLWSAPKEDTRPTSKKRLQVSDDPVDGDDQGQIDDDPAAGAGGIILENEPIRLEGVVRSDDPSEFQKPLEVEKGFAKNLANLFLSQQQEAAAPTSSGAKRFQMDIQAGEPEVHENEPVRLEGVVRSGDKTEDVIGKRGSIRSIAGRFANPSSFQRRGSSSSSSDSSDSDSEDDKRKARPPPARRPLAARHFAAVANSDVLAENEPAELDPNIVRSTDGYRANDPVLESGWAKNMAERWRQQQEQEAAGQSTHGGGGSKKSSKPAWLIELENAKEAEHGVFENEPEVRDDVVHADDEKPDVISVQHTRNLRKMWSQIEKDSELADKQPKNRPLPRQKEPSPEPEPPKPQPPPEEPKPRFGARRPVGRLAFGQLQKEEPAPVAKPAAVVAKPEPAKSVASKFGNRFQQQQQQQQQQPPAPAQPIEVETKTSKMYFKPALKPIQKK